MSVLTFRGGSSLLMKSIKESNCAGLGILMQIPRTGSKLSSLSCDLIAQAANIKIIKAGNLLFIVINLIGRTESIQDLIQPVFFQIPFIQLGLLVFQTNLPALYKRMSNEAAAHIEDISLADHNIGVFSCFYGASPVINP